MTTSVEPHSLLGLQDLPADEMRRILDAAVRADSGGFAPDLLSGMTIANLFFEDSTRTRLSFTIAAQRLGARVADLTTAGSSVNKGETVIDTARTVEAMGVCAMVIRHRSSGACNTVAQHVEVPVINAGDGKHEHPTQGLLDVYTIARRLGRSGWDLSGVKVAIVGDLLNSRVARSDVAAITALGGEVVLVGPPTLAPASMSALGCGVSHDFDASIEAHSFDVVIMLRVQFERHEEKTDAVAGIPAAGMTSRMPAMSDFVSGFQLNTDRLSRMPSHVVVMHPGPMNRGIEIVGDVADGAHSAVIEQVRCGVPVRMAVLARSVGLMNEKLELFGGYTN